MLEYSYTRIARREGAIGILPNAAVIMAFGSQKRPSDVLWRILGVFLGVEFKDLGLAIVKEENALLWTSYESKERPIWGMEGNLHFDYHVSSLFM